MSKLNFSNITEAYTIPSTVIKETANEITRLKKIVEDSTLNKQSPPPHYERIGSPDKVEATFCKDKGNLPPSDDFEYTFLKLSRSPQFDDIIKNYIIYKHPDWLLNSTSYSPSKERFGASNLPTDIKHYVIFFIVSIVIYLLLSLLLKRK